MRAGGSTIEKPNLYDIPHDSVVFMRRLIKRHYPYYIDVTRAIKRVMPKENRHEFVPINPTDAGLNTLSKTDVDRAMQASSKLRNMRITDLRDELRDAMPSTRRQTVTLSSGSIVARPGDYGVFIGTSFNSEQVTDEMMALRERLQEIGECALSFSQPHIVQTYGYFKGRRDIPPQVTDYLANTNTIPSTYTFKHAESKITYFDQ